MLINSAILAINNGTSAQIVPSMELTAILRRSTLVETRWIIIARKCAMLRVPRPTSAMRVKEIVISGKIEDAREHGR